MLEWQQTGGRADFGVWEMGCRRAVRRPTAWVCGRTAGPTVWRRCLDGNYYDDRAAGGQSGVCGAGGRAESAVAVLALVEFQRSRTMGRCKISTNNGASWEALAPAYLGGSGSWQSNSLDLVSYVGQMVRVGFYFYSHQTWDSWYGRWYDTVGPGWYIDEVGVYAPGRSADLLVLGIGAPTNAVSGQPVRISWTITNQGNAPARNPWQDTLYLANDPTGASALALASFTHVSDLGTNQSTVRTETICTAGQCGRCPLPRRARGQCGPSLGGLEG